MQTKAALSIFTLTTLSLFWFGCEIDATEAERATSSDLANSPAPSTTAAPLIVPTTYESTNLTTLRATHAPIPAAIDIQPANGTVFDNVVTGTASINFTGFALSPGQTVDVQVLASPGLAVGEASWVTIASTKSEAIATTFGDPTPIYRWATSAQPGTRWDQGGVLRYRTIAGNALMPFYDTASGDCIKQQNLTSWRDVIKSCKSPFSPGFGDKLGSTVRAAAILSPTPEPGDGTDTPYLSRKGVMFPSQTDDYYAAINAPSTLAEFISRFGFLDGGEVDATYYNLGDLGIGREMHCTQFNDVQSGASTACYVKNYGELPDGSGNFSGDPDSAMEDAVAGTPNFATVAMVKFGSTFDEKGGNDVQFFVYNATDDIVDEAQLDSIGSNKTIPNNCLNCHGGNYDPGTLNLRGSTFLPFDPNAFLYSEAPGFSYFEQADQLRQLNAMMKAAGAPPSTSQFVDGTYASGNTANLDWIPPGWSTSDEAKTVYREVYKPYCRTCHTAQIGEFSFITYDDFKLAADKTMQDTCVTSQMPVCEATMSLFWRGAARAYLINALGSSSTCTPGTF